jgi:hypothetical protein
VLMRPSWRADAGSRSSLAGLERSKGTRLHPCLRLLLSKDLSCPVLAAQRTKSPAERLTRCAGRRAWWASCTPKRSDSKSHTNDCFGDRAQAGVVVAGVAAHELVGVIDRDRFPLGGDPLGLFDDDP